MNIMVQLGQNESADRRNGRVLRLLNWMVRENEDYLRRTPDAPLLYSRDPNGRPVCRYQRESFETWSTIPACLAQGWEDCDSLAAWRAAELRTWGGRALEPGCRAYRHARHAPHLRAQAFLRTKNHQIYHCLVRFLVDGTWHYDDPSLRLGMRAGRFLSASEVEADLDKQLRDRDVLVPLSPDWALAPWSRHDAAAS